MNEWINNEDINEEINESDVFSHPETQSNLKVFKMF